MKIEKINFDHNKKIGWNTIHILPFICILYHKQFFIIDFVWIDRGFRVTFSKNKEIEIPIKEIAKSILEE